RELVGTAWDLGIGDETVIVFYQQIHREVRIIDYYAASGEGLVHYAKVLRDKPYAYDRHVGPHDLEARELGTGKTRLEQARMLGIKFTVTPRLPLDDGIAAVRALLPRCWIDEQKCAPLLSALAAYRKDWSPDRETFSPKPRHDWSSHAADAMRYL